MVWLQLVLLALVAMTASGCELAAGIFKTGAWVGALAVMAILVIAAIIASKIRG